MDMISKGKRKLAVNSGAGTSPLSMLLKAWLNHDLSAALETGRSLAVFVVRIDDYRDLLIDHDDETLETVMTTLGSRLKESLRSANALMRSAEDRFTIIHAFEGDPLALHSMAKRMLQHLQKPVRLGDDDLSFSASIGIAFYPEDGNSADLLLERAQEALDRTDRWGGNGFCLYSRASAKTVAVELSKREDLRRALDADDLTMHFQPVLDLPRNCMTAVSGEVHWQHPEYGRVDSKEIASIAGRAGFEFHLNTWMADRVFRQLIDWRGAGIDRSISVDVSRAQISDGRLTRLISDRLSTPGLTADLLEIRLNQDALLPKNDHRLRTGLHDLADLGISLCLSHVGGGPLAFQCLHSLPFQSVSLEPNMIAVIGRCASAEAMLEAMIGFFHSLGLTVRAVGVRFQEQVDFLNSHGCDEATGPFFAPALKSIEIDRLTDISPCVGRRDNVMLMPQQMSMH